MKSVRGTVAAFVCAATCCAAITLSSGTSAAEKSGSTLIKMDDAKSKDWLARWDKSITDGARNRYCDKELGEEIGWLMSPFLNGFYYGYMATDDPKWVDFAVDWTDSWVKRGVKEPDGHIGWHKPKAAGTLVDNLDDYDADSLLGESMALRPMVLLSGEILKTPKLKDKYGAEAEGYLRLAEQVYEKWDERGAWRPTKGGGTIPVVLPFGIDAKTGKWTGSYERRNAPGNGFSVPNNKAMFVARWLLALSDVTGKAAYRERSAKWFRLMKSRMKLTAGGTYEIWNYWEPAGPWDYKPDGSPKHWIGRHPNAGYYQIDVAGIVDAYEHGLVFDRADIDRLIATAAAEKVNWQALVPYSPEIQRKFEGTLKPESWEGLGAAPWYLMLQSRLRKG